MIIASDGSNFGMVRHLKSALVQHADSIISYSHLCDVLTHILALLEYPNRVVKDKQVQTRPCAV